MVIKPYKFPYFETKYCQMRNLLLLVLFLGFIQFACKKVPTSFKNADLLKEYIGSYSGGMLSSVSPIKVQFNSDIVTDSEVGEELKKSVISFSPSINGTQVWENKRTLVFQPAKKLDSGESYVATLYVSDLIKGLPKEANEFKFDFRVKEQFVKLTTFPLELEEQNGNKFIFSGELLTNDFADDKTVEKILSFNTPGIEGAVRWNHAENHTAHKFYVNVVAKENQEGKAIAKLNSGVMNVAGDESSEQLIPKLNSFYFTGQRVVNEADQEVRIYFNSSLDPSQDLAGLVSCQVPFTYRMTANYLSIYPANRFSGNLIFNIAAAVRNIRNETLSEPLTISVKIEDIKPAVKVPNDNMILPQGDKLLFPFEAVNLTAVDVEIFKIYSNNVLNYLQSDNSYEINRVGKVILQTRISLADQQTTDQLSKWNTYAIDLAQIMKPDPTAIYEIRIGFKKSYSSYSCQEDVSEPIIKKEEYYGSAGSEFEDPDFRSIMDSYYGYYGYFDGYNYEDRNNPCKYEYYRPELFKRSSVLASNIGITAKYGKNGELLVITTDLVTAQVMSGVDLSFYDFQLQQLSKGTTGSDGSMVTICKTKPYAIVANHDGMKSYLTLFDNKSLDVSQFDIVGTSDEKGMKGYLYGERGVWRPGDSLFLNFMLNDVYNPQPDNLPISFELYDPRGVQRVSMVATKNYSNLYPLYVATKPEDPTGTWKAIVKAGGASFTYPIKIETIKPNRLRMELDFGGRKPSYVDGNIKAVFKSSWLYGAPAKGLTAKVEVKYTPINEPFPKYPAYNFMNEKSKYNPEWITVLDGTLNELGQSIISHPSPSNNSKPPGRMNMYYKMKVVELGGDFSQGNAQMTYDPFSHYVGVNIPKNSYGYYTYGIDQNIPISVMSLSASGVPAAGQNIDIKISKATWRWWWEGDDYYYNYEQAESESPVFDQSVVTGSNGLASVKFKEGTWGRYYVQTTDTRSGHTSGMFIYIGYPENDDQYLTRKAASIVPVALSREEVKVGERVSVKVNCPVKSRVLISLENGSKVLKTIWNEAKEGDNAFDFIADKSMAPNVYVHVTIIQPFTAKVNDLPARMYGITPLLVVDPSTKLNPTLKMAPELKPETMATIDVAETNGKPMAYTIDVVDEGLLDITNFKTPDPNAAFNARTGLGVKTWDLFDRIMGAFVGNGVNILSIGGDAGKAQTLERQKSIRFKPMVVHLGPFKLGAGAKAKHSFKVPNYIGSVRTMVVAINEAGGTGSSELTVPVKKPLMVLASFPRVIAPGEEIRLPVNVFVMDPKVKNVSISVTDNKSLMKTMTGNQTLSFTKPDEKVCYFTLKAPDVPGNIELVISATGNGEKSYEKILAVVRNANPYQTTTETIDLGGTKSGNLKLEPVGMTGTNSAILEVTTLPPMNLEKRMDYLVRYPYGCLEQTVSSVFPQLYLAKLVKADQKYNTKMVNNINSVINKLKNFASSDGGFVYWPGGSVDHWSSAYAGHFLVEAKAQGFNVPTSMYDKWLKNMKKIASNWDINQYNSGYYSYGSAYNQAYRLYVLAKAQSPNLGAMNSLREYKDLDRYSAALLAAAYASVGRNEMVNKLLANRKLVKEYYYDSFGSDLREAAILLECYVATGKKSEALQVFQSICNQLNTDNYYDTQALGFALSNVLKYVGTNKMGGPVNFAFNLPGGKVINYNSKDPIAFIQLPWNGKSSSVSVKNLGGSLTFFKVVSKGQAAPGKESTSNQNLNMSVVYKDAKGASMNATKLKRGTDIIATITVNNPGSLGMNYKNLALNYGVPSGWEIMNERLNAGSSSVTNSAFDYQDIRDDAVRYFFPLQKGESRSYQVRLTATYPGRYYLPATYCEHMYNNNVNSSVKGQWIEVE